MNGPIPIEEKSHNPASGSRPAGATELNMVKDILSSLLRNWYWLFISVVLFGVGSKIYLRYSVPIYNIHSRFLIKKPSSSSQDQELQQLNIINNDNDVGNELEVLRTKLMMQRTIHQLQLNVTCWSLGHFKHSELYHNAPFEVNLLDMYSSATGASWHVTIDPQGTGVVLSQGEKNGLYHWGDTVSTSQATFVINKNEGHFFKAGEYLLSISPEDATTSGFINSTKIYQGTDGTDVIEMEISDPIPQRGKDVLNTLYEVYSKANVEDQNTTADNTIDFINNRLNIVQKELSGVEKNIQDFKTANHVTDLSSQTKAMEQNEQDLEKDLVQQRIQQDVINSVEDYIQSKIHRVVPPSLVVEDPEYRGLVTRYNMLVVERDNQLAVSKPKNPLIVEMNAQLDTLKRDLLSSLENVKNNLKVTASNLTNRLDQAKGLIAGVPAKERAFLEISRDQTIKQQLYLFLLQKREETAISKSGTLSNSRLIEPAVAAAVPFKPNRPNIYLTCLGLGLLIPASVIILKELLNNKIMSRQDVVMRTATPILGEIGHNHTQKSLVVEKGARSGLAEQFRAIRANLQFMLTGKAHNVILVTSSISGEGKSFIALNLANSLAISGKKVALMELDLRKPRLSQELDMSNHHGFSNYVASGAELKYLPVPVPDHPDLYLISSGPLPPNPAELLMQDKTRDLFEYLYANFDYIVMDTPPIGLVTDALTLAAYADTCIYVARQNYTSKEQLSIVEDLFAHKKMKGLSIILNDIRKKSGAGNGYGYGYGYGYSSGYYSNGTEEKPGLWKRIFLKKNHV